jgi:hypothetical protein
VPDIAGAVQVNTAFEPAQLLKVQEEPVSLILALTLLTVAVGVILTLNAWLG